MRNSSAQERRRYEKNALTGTPISVKDSLGIGMTDTYKSRGRNMVAATPLHAKDGASSALDTYKNFVTSVELLHRRFLDVIKEELSGRMRDDVSPVQAYLCYQIGSQEVTAGELRSRGYYLGSNANYNVKKLIGNGLLDHQRSRTDKRSVRIKLTTKGHEIAKIVEDMLQRQSKNLEKVGDLKVTELSEMLPRMQKLDRFWNDTLLYRI